MKSLFRILRSVISLLILICVVVFMTNNAETSVINLYPLPFEIATKTFMVMIIFFLLGFIFAILICSKTIIKKSAENFGSRQKIKKLEKQISQN